MKRFSLLVVSMLAATFMSGAAFAKHKHRIPEDHCLQQETQYFDWFRTSSRACLVDMLGEQYVRHMYGEGNHNPPSPRPQKNPT
ncbi:MAG: hypothetical protein ABIN69_11985 [Aestuariivirga sp.]